MQCTEHFCMLPGRDVAVGTVTRPTTAPACHSANLKRLARSTLIIAPCRMSTKSNPVLSVLHLCTWLSPALTWTAHVCSAADPAHSSSAASPTQLVTYSSLPPMPPAMATAQPDQHPPRHRSVKWPVAASSSRTADQLPSSPGRPTLLQASRGTLSEGGPSVDQVRARCVAAYFALVIDLFLPLFCAFCHCLRVVAVQ